MFLDKKKQFDEEGFWIEKNLLCDKDMDEMFFLVYEVFFSLIGKFTPQILKDYPTPELVNRKNNLKELDKMICTCSEFDKKIIGEAYDIIAYSSTFLRLISDKRIENITNELLGRKIDQGLYAFTNRTLIKYPSEDREYGWHQEVFYTIPESNFLQTWAPIIRESNSENGSIWIVKKSHKSGIIKQSYDPNRATVFLVDDEFINSEEIFQVELELNDVLFFNGKLLHRSGNNKTIDEVRFSMVGMWHDIISSGFRGPKPSLTQRTSMTQYEYWQNINKNNNWNY